MTEQLIKVRDEGTARIITLNRPEKRNALSIDLLEQMEVELDKVAEDTAVRSLIITGEGKGFCAGIDLMNLSTVTMGVDPANFRRLVRRLQDFHNRLANMEKPVICVMHGFCMGMGLELALACDVRICEAGTAIHIAEARLGLIPDLGGTTRLVRVVGMPRAKELIMTGKTIDAADADKWGLVNEVCEAGEGLSRALAWHDEFEKSAPLAVGLAKVLCERAYDIDTGASLALEGIAQSTLFNTEDFREGVMARLEKRTPTWKNK